MDATNKRVLAVISGDLVRSRSIEDRVFAARKIEDAIRRTNEEFADELYAPLAQTRGIDELSGVLKRPAKSYRLCTHLNQYIEPWKFRFAVVHDWLDVGLDTHDARRIDGPAFHRAADLLASPESRRLTCIFGIRNHELLSRVLTELAKLEAVLRSEWTDHQKRVWAHYEQLQNQEKVADDLRISQQAVSNALVEAHWREVRSAWETIDWSLAQVECETALEGGEES